MTKPKKAKKPKEEKEDQPERSLDEIMGALLKVPKERLLKVPRNKSTSKQASR